MTTSVTNGVVDATMAAHPAPETNPGLSVVVAYGDAPAARRALHLLDDAAHAEGEQVSLCPQLWRFDVLEVAQCRAEATLLAVQADLLIITTSNKANLPAPIQAWIRACLNQKQGHAAAVVALLGPADDADPPGSPRLEFLSAAATAAGLGFFAPTPQAAPTPLAAALGPKLSRSADILLLEDDRTMRQLSAATLARAGYRVNAVEGSQAAWEALAACSYGLLITDNQMPGMSGLELVRKLRSAQSALPVIIASGGFVESELAHNQWLQPATVLPKPFTSAALLSMVARVLPPAARVPARPGLGCPRPEDSLNRSNRWGINE